MHRYQAKAALHPRPAKPDPPLKLNAPNPTFVNAKQNSAFGFKSGAPSGMALDLDADVDMEQEGVEHAEEHFAEENFNDYDNYSESHSLLLYRSLKYLLLDDCDDIYYNGSSSFTSYITRLIQIRTFN
jgi:hypothetical protein